MHPEIRRYRYPSFLVLLAGILLFLSTICHADICMDTTTVRLQLEDTHGNVASFIDKRNKHNHIASKDSSALWLLHLRGEKGTTISPDNAGDFFWELAASSPQALHLHWTNFDFDSLPGLSVHVHITEDIDGNALQWTIETSTENNTCPDIIHFPRFPAITKQASEVLAVPYWIGEKTAEVRHLLSGGKRREWTYPGILSMQCITFYSDDGPGLYLFTDDTHARSKSFAVFGDKENNIGLEICHFPNGRDMRNGMYTLPYTIRTGLFEGNWVDVAKTYREWALQQQWAQESRLKNGLTPAWAQDTGFWVWNRDHSSGVLSPAIRMQHYLELPVSVFWHWWHGCPYDVGFPEYLPPREGAEPFRTALGNAQTEGIHAIVYMNQRLWGMTTDSWTAENAAEYAVKGQDGTIRPEVYNTFTKSPCASMCMGTAFWRNKYAGLAEEAFASLGVNGIYMDQACSSLVCYDSHHEHAPGGGTYWMEGFRALESDIRKRCPGIALAGEGVGESWLPHLDLMLSLQVSMERYAAPGQWEPIPFFNAVYHGYAIQYGNYASLTRPPYDSLWPREFAPETPLQLLDDKFRYQFRMEQARSFVWGQQLCLANFTEEQLTMRTAELEYLKRLALLRKQALPYLLHGTFLGFPDLEIPEMEIPMSRLSIYAGQRDTIQEYVKTVPRIFSCIWQNDTGNIVVPVVNISDEPLAITLCLNSKDHNLPAKGMAYKILPDERKDILCFDGGATTIADTLSGAEVCIYEFISE